jgi:nucleotide sugar dehydrogenase
MNPIRTLTAPAAPSRTPLSPGTRPSAPTRARATYVPVPPRPRPTTTVAILGLGYVGLPTALAFAAAGTRVLGIDVSQRRLADIASGAVDLVDADHGRLRAHRGRELRCTDDVSALADADAVIVCVPTPIDAHHDPDLRALRGACDAVVAHARPGQLLVLTSTTYVGSTKELLVEPLTARGLQVGLDVFVAFAPERIDPGNVVHPQETVPRVVGGASTDCAVRAEDILGRVAPIHRVSTPEAAELCKLHENTFRAVNIAYSYELAQAAAAYGVDAREVIDAASSKPFGFMPFHPSVGVGGHCIPCDPHYLLKPLAGRGIESPIVAASMRAIAERPGRVVDRALRLLDERGIERRAGRVAVVGAAYKPGVADMRESPAVDVLRGLVAEGLQVAYHDPLIPTLEIGGLPMVSVTTPSATDYDVIVLACVHPETARFWESGSTAILDCTYGTIAPSDPRRAVL